MTFFVSNMDFEYVHKLGTLAGSCIWLLMKSNFCRRGSFTFIYSNWLHKIYHKNRNSFYERENIFDKTKYAQRSTKNRLIDQEWHIEIYLVWYWGAQALWNLCSHFWDRATYLWNCKWVIFVAGLAWVKNLKDATTAKFTICENKFHHHFLLRNLGLYADNNLSQTSTPPIPRLYILIRWGWGTVVFPKVFTRLPALCTGTIP